MDGSIPTEENATRYNEGDTFEINSTVVLRARAFDPSGLLQPSEVITSPN